MKERKSGRIKERTKLSLFHSFTLSDLFRKVRTFRGEKQKSLRHQRQSTGEAFRESVPLEITTPHIFQLIFGGVLRKVEVGHQFRFNVLNGIVEGVGEFIEVFFIKKHFMLLINKTVTLRMPTAFGNCQIVVVSAGGLNVKKIRTFSGPYALGKDFFFLFFFHNLWWFGVI